MDSIPIVVINEIEANGDPDWVEIYNPNDHEVDISGWTVMDGKPNKHADQATPLAPGTMIEAHGTFVFRGDKDFSFALGNKSDAVTLRDANGNIIDQFSWISKAGLGKTWQRIPDGIGQFVVGWESEGELNDPCAAPCINHLILNEVDSSPTDWIELYNDGFETIDLAGYEIRDSKNSHRWRFTDDAFIDPGVHLVVDDSTRGMRYDAETRLWVGGTFNIGFGSADSVRVFDASGKLIQQISWTERACTEGDPAKATIGRIPDGSGYFTITKPTPGSANCKAENPGPRKLANLHAKPWPGDQSVTVIDEIPMFLKDSSGLDVDGNVLWAVDDKHGTIWKMTLDGNGYPTLDEKWLTGKMVNFQKDGKNADAAGPDSEGITADGQHNIYLAVERDRARKGVNYNVVLKVNASALESDEPILVADQEWNLTSLLPEVSANMGIEGIEWVANSELEGKIIDANTGSPYRASDYPEAIADGLFFVCLEYNGHVYAFALNDDCSATLIADIDAGMGGAMALDYNVETHTLWVEADNGYDGHLATIEFDSAYYFNVEHSEKEATRETASKEAAAYKITYYNRPSDMPNVNNEGFAIASSAYGPDGKRPVYWFEDGAKSHSLRMSYLPAPDESRKPEQL